jgi:peptide/nickel transport system substrate-binding protein
MRPIPSRRAGAAALRSIIHPIRSVVAPLLVPLLLAIGAPDAPHAQVLRIGTAVETTSLDPHVNTLPGNVQALRHIYEPLIAQDEQQRPVPGLATSWTMTEDPNRWILHLRDGVRFHDGSPFTAQDVVASLARAVNLPSSSASPYASYFRHVVRATALDALSVELVTSAPHPLLPRDLTVLMITPQRAANAASERFNSGELAVGTGPFRLRDWSRGGLLRLERHDGWWGPAPIWQGVQIAPVGNDASRISGLLAGQVDLIDHVLPAARASLLGRPDVRLAQTPTSRVVFLALDAGRAASPHVLDPHGAPVVPNPLTDQRVRRAISQAIDREAIVSQVLEGTATPAGQLVPDWFEGAIPAFTPERYDLAGARELLAAAGLPRGTQIALHGPNDRFVNDDKVLLAIGAMLRRLGFTVSVAAEPFSVHRTRQRRGDVSIYLGTWGTETGDVSAALRPLLAAPGGPASWGHLNFFGYSTQGFDALLTAAMAERDPRVRNSLFAQAAGLALQDRAVIPLYFQSATWASRRRIAYRARADEYTLAISAGIAE